VTRFTGRCLLSAAVLGGSIASAAADRPPSAVSDAAGLFRPAIIARANEQIGALRREYDFDVRVETLELPLAERKKVDGLALRRQKARYFAELGRKRAQDAGISGLYILICTNPRYVEVTDHPASVSERFSGFQQRQLHKQLVYGLQGAQPGEGLRYAAGAAAGLGWAMRPAAGPDAVLLDALRAVGDGLRERTGDPNAVRISTIGAILAGGIGLWAVLALVRRRMAERDPDGGLFCPTPPDCQPAHFAARFGNPAASWVYDRLNQGPRTVPPSAPPPAVPAEVAAVSDGGQAAPTELLHPAPDHADASAEPGAG
jgi:hypothetical protein